jgi:hypothetical protein
VFLFLKRICYTKGWANAYMEKEWPGTVVLFQNGDAGYLTKKRKKKKTHRKTLKYLQYRDVDPLYSLCRGDPHSWSGPAVFGQAVLQAAAALVPS